MIYKFSKSQILTALHYETIIYLSLHIFFYLLPGDPEMLVPCICYVNYVNIICLICNLFMKWTHHESILPRNDGIHFIHEKTSSIRCMWPQCLQPENQISFQEESDENLRSTIMDKSLRTNLHFWRFFTRAKQTVRREFIYTCSAIPSPPLPPYNVGQVYTLYFSNFSTLYGGHGAGGKQRILKRKTVLF